MTTPRGAAPGWPSWRSFLNDFHLNHPGITEETLGRAQSHGIDPYDWLLEPLADAGRLFDLACGSAPIAERHPCDWIGVDLSAAELRLARRRSAPNVVRADAGHLPIADRSFPAAVCSMAMMILQPLDTVLRELRRVLAPNGVAVALIPGTLPLTARDLARYTRLMIALRRSHLAYPNDREFGHLDLRMAAAGLSVVEDRRRRFALPIPDADTGRLFVRSLYLPGVAEPNLRRASKVAAGWAGTDIGIPLRRVTLRRIPIDNFPRGD